MMGKNSYNIYIIFSYLIEIFNLTTVCLARSHVGY